MQPMLLDLAASAWIFPVVLLLATVDGLFPVVPSEAAVLAVATTWAGTGQGDVPLTVIAAAAGAVLGDHLAYAVGRRLVRRKASGAARGAGRLMTAARGALERHGGLLFVAARWIPAGRGPVTLAAGATAYPRRRFAAWTALGAVVWAAGYATLGVTAGHLGGGSIWRTVAIGLAAVALVGVVGRRVARRRGERPQQSVGHPARSTRDDGDSDDARSAGTTSDLPVLRLDDGDLRHLDRVR